MKFKRIALLFLVFTLLGASTVFANTIYKNYLAKRVTVKVNDTVLKAPGLEVDKVIADEKGYPMASIEEMAASLGGLLVVEKDTYTIYKPNVQLSMHTYNKDPNELSRPYGQLLKGSYSNLSILAQVDNLKTKISALQLRIIDPFGSEIERIEMSISDHKEKSWYTFRPKEVNFKYSGEYQFNLYMKPDSGSRFTQVSQLLIESQSQN